MTVRARISHLAKFHFLFLGALNELDFHVFRGELFFAVWTYCHGERGLGWVIKTSSEEVQLCMTMMHILFQIEAVFTPSSTGFLAVKTDALYRNFGTA
jgi:hypothetical protein